ncbi:hypothetical protein ASF43_22390 [Pseudorhodoferax sp. Leaf267]|nr:hypothetical protein ASF43_22390 [Pseudorhodoferax sp. Leaf267]
MRLIALPLAVATAFALPLAYAQPAPGYTGPSAAAATPAPAQGQASGYTGPSSVQLVTVKQLLDTGKDDQHARLQGRIVSHDGDDKYTFADDTGRITVEVDAKRFPAGQTVSAEQRVELLGEFDKGLRKTEFEVDRLTLVR